MSGLKELRNRVKSVKSTKKITRAMQMVAAAKLRKAKDAVEASKPYSEAMRVTLSRLAARHKHDAEVPSLLKPALSAQNYLLIVATADRGLCGGFNSSIVKGAKQRIAQLKKEHKNIQIVCIGKKGAEQLKTLYGDLIIKEFNDAVRGNINYQECVTIKDYLVQSFEHKKFDICEIFYNKFCSAIKQEVSSFQLIPINVDTSLEEAKIHNSTAKFVYEPDTMTLLNHLLPRSLSGLIYHVLLENAASEQGARMTAMDNATKNAGEMIDKLTLSLNRTRQAQITTELVEIISGAEAL